MTESRTNAAQPTIATVIVNWNGCATTLACVETLVQAGQDAATIIVVDNGSQDDSVAVLRAHFAALTVVEAGENLGFARGNNLGIQAALAHGAPDYLFLLNNDAFVNAETLPQLAAALARWPQAGAAVPKIYLPDGQHLWYAGGHIDWKMGAGVHHAHGVLDEGLGDREGITGFATGCALLVRRTILDDAGLFDERYFFMGEDVDLSIRLAHAAQPLVYVPAATVVHHVGTSSTRQGQPFVWYHMTRNRLLTIAKHAHGSQKARFYAIWPLWWAVKAAVFAVQGQPEVAQAMWRGVQDFRAGRFGITE